MEVTNASQDVKTKSKRASVAPRRLVVPHMLTYRIFDDCLAVLCESPPLSKHIQCFMKLLAVSPDRQWKPNLRLAVFMAPENHLVITCPEIGFAETLPDGRAAWMGFRRVFAHLTVKTVRSHYILHASCVANRNGQAAVITGPSNAGKTSVLIGLLEGEYKLVADDYTVLDLEDCRVVALPTGVTAGTFVFRTFPRLEALKDLECRFRAEGQWQWTINPGDLYASAPAYDSFEITKVFVLTPDFGAPTGIREMSSKEALWAVQVGGLSTGTGSPDTDTASQSQERVFGLADLLSSRVSFFRVTNGNLQDTVRSIEERFPLE